MRHRHMNKLLPLPIRNILSALASAWLVLESIPHLVSSFWRRLREGRIKIRAEARHLSESNPCRRRGTSDYGSGLGSASLSGSGSIPGSITVRRYTADPSYVSKKKGDARPLSSSMPSVGTRISHDRRHKRGGSMGTFSSLIPGMGGGGGSRKRPGSVADPGGGSSGEARGGTTVARKSSPPSAARHRRGDSLTVSFLMDVVASGVDGGGYEEEEEERIGSDRIGAGGRSRTRSAKFSDSAVASTYEENDSASTLLSSEPPEDQVGQGREKKKNRLAFRRSRLYTS